MVIGYDITIGGNNDSAARATLNILSEIGIALNVFGRDLEHRMLDERRRLGHRHLSASTADLERFNSPAGLKQLNGARCTGGSLVAVSLIRYAVGEICSSEAGCSRKEDAKHNNAGKDCRKVIALFLLCVFSVSGCASVCGA